MRGPAGQRSECDARATSFLFGLPLFRRVGLDCQSVNFATDQFAERGVHHLVPRQTALAGEARTDNSGLIVTLAVGNDRCTRVFETLLYQGRNLTGIHCRLVSFSTGKPDSLAQMTGNTRNLLLFVSLAGAALATWVLARVAEQTDTPSVDSGPSLQGYYLLGATLLGTDDQGQVDYRIIADRVEQQGDSEALVLTKMSVEYTPHTDVRWNISAARATALEDLDVLQLQEEVRLVYETDAEQNETVFETSSLRLAADRLFASSDQPVTMQKDRASITATGLELDLETDFWKLESDVAIRFAP